MNERITKGDLAQRGMNVIDTARAETTVISRQAGGVSFASAIEVMEFAKLMSTADKAIGPHLRNNPGACLRIVFQAVEWQMSPWAVADKSYVVNDRLAYESQLIHAIIEARAPLRERLYCEYVGEGPERRCIVTGTFGNYHREYTSPQLKDIKVKNSPLWTADPDQQLWYYSSRAWARKWCPDVIAGLYTPDEVRANPRLGQEEAPASGLHARLVGGNVNREEGYQPSEDERVDRAQALADARSAEAKDKPRRKRKGPEEPTEAEIARSQDALGRLIEEAGEIAAAPLDVADSEPKTPGEYDVYCRLWLSATTDPDEVDARWTRERPLRNRCGLIEEDRKPLQELKEARAKELTA